MENMQHQPVKSVEGELKRIKSFWSSQKDIYRLNYPYLQVKRPLNKTQFEYKNKYDLKLYSLRLSKKEKKTFFLDPREAYFRLPRIEFETRTPEERAEWYLAIQQAAKTEELQGQQYISNKRSILDDSVLPQTVTTSAIEIQVETEPQSTLNEISEYLMREDTDLHSACQDAERAFNTLRVQLTDLQCADLGNKKLQAKVE